MPGLEQGTQDPSSPPPHPLLTLGVWQPMSTAFFSPRPGSLSSVLIWGGSGGSSSPSLHLGSPQPLHNFPGAEL